MRSHYISPIPAKGELIMPQPALEETSTSSLTGAGLAKALAEGKFEEPPAQLIGMVKPSAKRGHINFAPAGCESWIDIPSDMIEVAKHLGHQACRDHSHPLFRLSLKEPEETQAKILLSLLSRYSAGESVAREHYRAPHTGALLDDYDRGDSGFDASGFSHLIIDNDVGGVGGLNAWTCKRCNCFEKCEWVWELFPNSKRRVKKCRQVCDCIGCRETLS
jgi:hypothetical protein